MPIWLVEFARWLGVTKDSTRPNWGVFLLVLAGVLYALGIKESDISAFGGGVVGIASVIVAAAAKFASSPDNMVGTLLGGIGILQLRGKNGGALTPEQRALLASMFKVEEVRRKIATPRPELQV